jgi:hypothetical protein
MNMKNILTAIILAFMAGVTPALAQQATGEDKAVATQTKTLQTDQAASKPSELHVSETAQINSQPSPSREKRDPLLDPSQPRANTSGGSATTQPPANPVALPDDANPAKDRNPNAPNK